MRWNCPHCGTLVNLNIDLDRTPKAYVRCGKCMGIALIQKNAHADQEALPPERDLAKGFMSAREALQEEQVALQNSQRGLADDYFDRERTLKIDTGDADETRLLDGERMMEMDGAPAPELDVTRPTREFRAKTQLPRPPAFLLSAAPMQNPASPALYTSFHVDTEAEQRASRVRSIVILAFAAAAFIGGIYLFARGQAAMVQNRLKIEKALRRIEAVPLPAPAGATVGSTAPSNAPNNDAIQLESAATIARVKAVAPSPQAVRVIVPTAILRSGPSTEFGAIDHLSQNELLTIRSFRGNWIQVEGRKQGWLRNDLVSMLGSETAIAR